MANLCSICVHPKRLLIDRRLVEGGGLANVAREFVVGYEALRIHSKEHIARQLVTAMEKQMLIEGNDLLNTINKIITRAEDIFQRNYNKGSDITALKALDSQRNTIDLLAKISYQLHQAKMAELQLLKEKRGETDEQLKLTYQQNLSVLSMEELLVYQRLQNKILYKTRDKVISGNRVLVYNNDSK